MKVHIHHFHAEGAVADEGASRAIQKQWATYQKLVDHNSLASRQSCAILHEALAKLAKPFSFLDIACGDAGQMQRALFARLLLQDADIILLDEPFTAIDARTTADLLALVQRWHGEARTVIAVLHDIETVKRAFPQTLLMAREAVAWGATENVLTAENQLKARRMVEAFDSHAPACDRKAA